MSVQSVMHARKQFAELWLAAARAACNRSGQPRLTLRIKSLSREHSS